MGVGFCWCGHIVQPGSDSIQYNEKYVISYRGPRTDGVRSRADLHLHPSPAPCQNLVPYCIKLDVNVYSDYKSGLGSTFIL